MRFVNWLSDLWNVTCLTLSKSTLLQRGLCLGILLILAPLIYLISTYRGIRMTLDQEIQVWNAVGTWIASIGTVTAVWHALHMARKAEAIKVRMVVDFMDRKDINGTTIKPVLFGFIITNLDSRSVTIGYVGWSIGIWKNNKRFRKQPLSNQQCPKEITYGKSAAFLISFDDWKNNLAISHDGKRDKLTTSSNNWTGDFTPDFIKDTSDRNLKTLRAFIDTSVGERIELVPEKELLEKFREIKRGVAKN